LGGMPVIAENNREPVRAFCVDFNWGYHSSQGSGFAKPGLWADADPAKHVAWYEALGVNVIQTFNVSCNGYAWYKGGKIPEQPGLVHDFLPEMVKLGHAKKMKVMGYFCIGSNTRWGKENPELSYDTVSMPHIPLTDNYLDFLAMSIEEGIVKSGGMDGFMIDWVWCPGPKIRKGKWIDAEKKLFEQITGQVFPGEDKLTNELNTQYERKAIDRCWERIRSTAKRVDPKCTIWLSLGHIAPCVFGSNMLREVDWAMSESGDINGMRRLAKSFGKDTRLLLCAVGWRERHKAGNICADAVKENYGIYGFAKPNADSMPLPIDTYLSKPIDSFSGNDRNIAILAYVFKGKTPPEPGADKR
jgi:hypothetical protein